MANEVQLIDAVKYREVLEEEISFSKEHGNEERVHGLEIAVADLMDAPTIDPESLRPKGHWEIHCRTTYDSWTQETDEEFYLECSECKREVWNIDQSAAMGGEYRKLIEQYPYCHCGCKMER